MLKLSKKINQLIPYMTVYQLRALLERLGEEDELTLVQQSVNGTIGTTLTVVSKSGSYKGTINFSDGRFYNASEPQAHG